MPRSALVPFLQKAGLIHDQHTVVPELFDQVQAQVITYRVGVPACGAQQALHRLRATQPGVLGQIPAVLALQVSPTAITRSSVVFTNSE